MRILVVGSEALAARHRDALRADHHHVAVASDDTSPTVPEAVDLVILETGDPHATRRMAGALSGTTTRLLVLAEGLSGHTRAAVLDAGADDCLSEPCHQAELRARVRALLRRGADHRSGGLLHCGPVALDPDAQCVLLRGSPLALSSTEYRVLRCLLRHAGTVVTRQQLIEEVWAGNLGAGSNAPDVYVSYLRRRLSPDGERLIRTVRSVGYLVAEGETPQRRRTTVALSQRT